MNVVKNAHIRNVQPTVKFHQEALCELGIERIISLLDLDF